MDELKKYLQNNRQHIDTDMPGEELWKGVKNRLHPTARIPAFAKWMAAACLVLAIGTGVYFFTHPAKDALAVDITSKDTPAITPVEPLPSIVADAPKKEMEPPSKSAGTEENDAPALRKGSSTPATSAASAKKTTPAKRRQRIQAPAPLYGFERIEASYAAMLDMQLERVRTQPIYAEDPEYFHLFKKQFNDLANDEEHVKQQLKQGYQEALLDELVTIYQRKITVLKQLQFEINKMNSKVKQTDAGIQLQNPSYINL